MNGVLPEDYKSHVPRQGRRHHTPGCDERDATVPLVPTGIRQRTLHARGKCRMSARHLGALGVRSAACFPGRLPKKAQLTVGDRVWGDGPVGASPDNHGVGQELAAATRC